MFNRRSSRIRSAGNAQAAPWTSKTVCLLGIWLCAGCITTPGTPSISTVSPQGQGITACASTANRAPALGCVPEECLRRVQEKLDEFREERKCPGVTLGFVLQTGRGGALASGVSNKATGRAMTPDDRMLLGSIGKTYVAAVLLKLVEEGRVELDTKISRWLGRDEWFSRLPNAHDITLRILMNHTSGIPRYIYTPEFQAAVKAQPHKIWRPEELVSFILDAEPLFPAEQGWSYADTNYILAGMIVERVTGRTYYEELSDRVLRPLGLSDTSPSDRAELAGLVSGYTPEGNVLGLPVEVARDGRYAINPQFEWTGGGLVTMSLDLARWAKLLYGGEVLKSESLRQMLDGVETARGSDRTYGLAAMMRPSAHGPVVGHAGYMPGYVSMMAYYLDHDAAVAVQVNTDVRVDLLALEKLLDDLAEELLRR